MEWLHPGQGTVFPNAFFVTFKILLQFGQFILKDINSLPKLSS